MKQKKFERELKVLINYIRAYGIQHINYSGNMQEIIQKEDKNHEFTQKVHKGFELAQRNVIFLLKNIINERKRMKADLKIYRQNKDKKRSLAVSGTINELKYQEMVLRKIIDSIAWQLFNFDLSTLRRFYYGQELIDITDSNLDSELRYAKNCIKKNPDGFVLISDLTSFIQIGDVITFIPGKGLSIGELKEGEVNGKVFNLMKESMESMESMEVMCPYYLNSRLNNEGEKFKEQFLRDIKQLKRNMDVLKVINEGEGTDLLTGKDIKISQETLELNDFSDIVNNLLKECDKKGYAISVIEDCLLVGVYKTGAFPSEIFDSWAKSLNIKMPIMDLRQAFFDPLAYPLYLHPFSDSFLLDIILGRKIIKMTIDIDKWLDTFKQKQCTYRWMSIKETARLNSEFKGKLKIFSIDGKGIEL